MFGNNWKRIIAVSLMSLMLLNKSCKSEVYTVGGEQGWNSDTNFGDWSKDFNFTVGDVLVFKYEKEHHNVYEVTETAYRTCVTNNGVILAKYETGNDKVILSQKKKYWFVCNKVGHCLGGMRFHIELKPPSSSSSNPTPHSSSTVTFLGKSAPFIYLSIVLSILFLF